MKHFDEALNFGLALPPDKLPEFFGEWERVRVAVSMQRLTAPAAPAPPALEGAVSTREAVKLTGFSRSYLHHHWKELPFCEKKEGKLLWSRAGIDAWIRNKPIQ